MNRISEKQAAKKAVPLATGAEKSGGLLSLLVLAALLTVLLLRSEGAAFWLLLLAGTCVLLLLGAYTAAVFAAAAEVDREGRKLRVRGIGGGEVILSGAVTACTEEVRLGSLVSRRIVFRGGDGEEVASLITLMTSRRGGHAETAAEALADALDLRFVPTVEKHLYDRKAARDKRRSDEEATRRTRAEKRDARHGAHPSSVVRPSAAQNEAEPETNYDELDDWK